MDTDPNELPLVNSLDKVTPTLRRELAFRPQSFGGETCYVVEDPVNSRFFRIGVNEYTFISVLDGQTTITEAMRLARKARPGCVFTPSDALAICHWVVRTGLAHDGSVDALQSVSGDTASRSTQRRGARFTPLSIQIPLFHPDRFFQQLRAWLGWCFSFPAGLIWLFVAGLALRDLIIHADRVVDSSSNILAANNWIWLGVAWVTLKVIHECGHAVACKRLGGEVREAGIILILFAPLAYVDVTSSWRLRSKWARIQVAGAGMYVELFLAALATLIWCRTAPGIVHHLCFNVMMTASVMTVLFNANPLMRFDGYYILSDFLELPNLYSLGQQYLGYFARRYLLGMRAALPHWPKFRAIFIRLYGFSSLLWRNLVFFGLVLTAATLFQGAGVALSLLALVLWLGSLGRRLLQFAGQRHEGGGPNWIRFAIGCGGGLAAAAVLLVTVPWPGTVVAPAIVRYAPRTLVRAESDGFVQEIRVNSGSHVKMGQVVVVLGNEELEHELAELNLAIRESQLNRRIYQRNSELAKAQAESERLRTLEKQHAEKKDEVAHLIVRAPRSGSVIGRSLRSLQGTYLTRGSEILSIGNAAAKEVRLSIAQHDIDAFRDRQGASLRAYFPDGKILKATLSKIEPRASDVPIDASLCAPDGGDLAVRQVDDEDMDGLKRHGYELLSPRFAGTMPLQPAQSCLVFAGQRARVTLRPCESVGEHLYRLLADWIDKRLGRRGGRNTVAHAPVR